jgi:hypothetical protein
MTWRDDIAFRRRRTAGSLTTRAADAEDDRLSKGQPVSHSHIAAAPDDSLLVKVKFAGVVLVCGDCEERSNGPSKFKARSARKELKRGLVQSPVRLRIVESTCLGLCPKKAIAATAVAPGHKLLAAELCDEEDAQAFAATIASHFGT